LRELPVPHAADVLVGLDNPDDAAVVRLSDDNAIVVTLDFFTPVVDDPRDFGRIAATNALSDVYAMGATPLVALNIAAFPSKTLPMSLLGEILRGGAEVARDAGIIIAGGHTIDDPEPKYGLSVVGTVHPDRIWTKGGARAGDALVLTKALGTGVLSTAIKRDLLTEKDPEGRAMVASMCTLNRRGAEVAKSTKVTVHAATDVTGYGLAGHLLEMLRQSTPKVHAELDASAIVALPGALELARKGVIPGGTKSNRDHVGAALQASDEVDSAVVWLCVDAQTSGGLLFSVPEGEAEDLVRALQRDAGLDAARVVGRVVSARDDEASAVRINPRRS
jgi:selenide,water dikinase